MSWSIVVDDSFTRSDTSTGSAGTTTGAGNSWTDVNGSVWQIVSNDLKGTPDGTPGTAYLRDFLTRPSGENSLDSRIVIDLPTSIASGSEAGIALRYSSGPTYYLAHIDAGSNKAYVYKVVSGTVTPIINGGSFSTSYNSAHTYSVDFSAEGSSPTTLTITVTDTTASSVVYTNSATDSAAGLQVSGQYGLVVWTASGSNASTYTRVRTYAPSPALSVGTPTVTSNGTGGIALSASVTGGTAPYSTQWHRSTTSGFSPGGGTTIGSPVSGDTPTYTDTTGTEGAVYYYKAVTTDSAGTPATATSAQIEAAPNRAAVVVGFVGDSLFSDLQSGQTLKLPEVVALMLAHQLGGTRTITISNQGVSGKATSDWTSGGSLLPSARTAMVSAGCTDIVVLLGTNDSRTDIANSASTVQTNLSDIATYLLAGSGIARVWLIPVPWASPNVHTSGLYTDAAVNRLATYQAVPAALANGFTIRTLPTGVPSPWTHFANVPGQLLDGVHPTVAGYEQLASIIVEALRSYYQPAVPRVALRTRPYRIRR